MNNHRHENPVKTSETHRDNLQKNLQHRLDVARANGDDRLVRQLEAEAQYIR